MKTKIYWINEAKIGTELLGTMSRPRGEDWLEDEIKSMKRQQVDCLVSLLERYEAKELGLAQEKEWCEVNGIEFINFPIEDVMTPNDEKAFSELVNELTEKINQQKKVVIHCRMGIGRSSMLASAIMIKKGIAKEEVFEKITKHRGLEVPDTEEQKKWVWGLADKLLLDFCSKVDVRGELFTITRQYLYERISIEDLLQKIKNLAAIQKDTSLKEIKDQARSYLSYEGYQTTIGKPSEEQRYLGKKILKAQEEIESLKMK